HAWSAVAASLVTHIVLFGVIYSFGVFNAAYVSSGLGSSSTVSLVGSTSTVFIPALGILSGRLANKFGYSRMAIVGSCVLGIGLLSASFATNSLPLLILTQGALFGIGSSFIYFPALSLPAQWFVKWRGVATGIAVSGAGIGGMLFSLISNKLIDAVGLAWTLRTLAIVCTVLLLLVTPFFKPRVKAPNSNIDWSVVKDARFVCLLFSCFFANFGMFVSVDYLPLVAENLGFSPYQGASLASIYNACSSVGRIATGIAADPLGATNAMMLAMWVSCISNFSWVAIRSFPGLCVFAIVNGFVGGAFWGLLPTVAAGMFGTDSRLVNILGMLYTSLAFGDFGSPPLTGFIKERF
ncbi:major facilitator superfamily domain-containing protein, partial [Chytriomyces sp. MP71]